MRIPLNQPYTITSHFGSRSYWNNGKLVSDFHNGTDFGVPKGTPVYASESGQVFNTWDTYGGGNMVVLNADSGRVHWYAHLDRFNGNNRRVNEGEVVGYVGSSGYATGVHLHWTLKVNGQFTNPEAYLHNILNVTNNTNMDTYTVQAGDNLSKIASQFGTTVENLIVWNNIPNKDYIQVGQVLKVRVAQPVQSDKIAELQKQLEDERKRLIDEKAKEIASRDARIKELLAQLQTISGEKASLQSNINQLIEDDKLDEQQRDELRAKILELEAELNTQLTFELHTDTLLGIADSFIEAKDKKSWLSDIIKQFTKYEWMYLLGIGLSGGVAIVALLPVEQWQTAGGFLAVVGSGATMFKLFANTLRNALTKRYDKNQDGVFDINDTNLPR